MNIDIFTLCDSVNCYDNKLVVVGNYDILIMQNPAVMPAGINLAGHIVFDEDECGEHNLRIAAIHVESGTNVLDINEHISIMQRDVSGSGTLNIALNGIPVVFQEIGKYRFSLYIDNVERAATLLNVMTAQ